MAKDFADISRIETAEEMNATNKRESVSKLMKAWESKNAKRAAQGAGLTTMAVTLAACGGSDDTSTPAPVTPVTPAGQSFTLTTDADTLVGTAGSDTFSGKAADLGASDAIIDSSSVDSDTLTLTGAEFATSIDTSGGATIRGIENVNFDFDSLTASSVDAAGVDSAATMTINQARDGSGAAFTVTNVITGSTVNAGTGVNSLTVTADAGATVSANGGAADTLVSLTTSDSATVNGSATVVADSAATATVVAGKGAASVTAAAATAINATGATITVTGGAEDAVITLTGTGTTDAATLNIGGDVSVTNTGTNATTVVETLTVASSAAAVVSVAAGTNYATTYVGDANTTFAGANAAFTGKTVTGASTLSLTTLSGTADLSKAAVDLISVDAVGASTPLLQVNDNANVKITKAQTAALEINADDDVANTATAYLKGTLNVDLAVKDAMGSVDLIIDASAAGTDGFDTVNLAVSKDQAAVDLVTDSTTAVVATGAGKLVLTGATVAKSLDASAMTGAVTVDQADILTVTTGSGKDEITLAATAKAAANAGAGNDTFKMGNISLAADATVDGGDGTDTLVISAAANISAATVASVEYVTLAGYALTVNDAQVNGETLVFAGEATNANDDLVIVADIDTATVDLSSLNGTLVDGVYFNATGSAYDMVSTTSGLAGNADAAAGLDTTALGSSVAMNVTGSMFDDVIVTGGGADVISSGKGDDEVSTGAGADVVNGGEGADLLVTGDGADAVTAGEGADVITAGAGADVIDLTETTAATDTVNIATGTDSVEGTASVAGYDSITGFAATATNNDKLLIADAKITATARTVADATSLTTETDTGTVSAAMSATGMVTVDGTSKANVDTLGEWIDIAEALIKAELTAVDKLNTTVTAAFEFGGNTYVVQGTDTSADDNGITYAQDAVVELVGLTGVTGLDGTAAANVIEIL